MSEVLLNRITDVELAQFCKMFGLELEQITQHQLRIENLIDFYPKRNRYFNLKTKQWGTAKTTDDLRNELIDTLPEISDPINEMKSWYVRLSTDEYSDFRQGQLSMLDNVLKLLLPESEYNKINKVEKI